MSACCGPDRGAREAPGPGGDTDVDVDVDVEVEAAAAADPVVAALAEQAPDQLRVLGLSGGTYRRGSEDPEAYRQDHEGPVRDCTVAPFALGEATVINAEFAVFVAATGHRTDAERHGDSLVFAGLLPESLRGRSPAVVETPWWRRVTGASWLHPEGPGSSVVERGEHPVVHVSRKDAETYARWVGGRLPSEAEWEFAARGGLDQQPYPWGAVFEPEGVPRMNTFQGAFPDAPTALVGTAPSRWFAPNGYGLHQMTGNVWEWTSGVFSDADPRPVLRGGSYLCHDSYCRRYRTSARTATTADTSLGHTGFRIAVDTD
ncbi:MAG: formylglycine-generating enzyme family protein [Micrococcaceae bacterium]